MTALDKYARIEAEGLWRQNAESQHRNVIVSVGHATLTITDTQDRPLAHWSLAAVARDNPGRFPAVFFPDGDPDERLELSERESEMVEAIERLQRVIEKRRPKPGRLRILITLGILSALVGLAVFWLPQAVKNYAFRVVPPIKQKEIGLELLNYITDFSGKPCNSAFANNALTLLGQKTIGGKGSLFVLPTGLDQTIHLPGNLILISRDLVEDFEDPDVLAGFVIAEQLRYENDEIFKDILNYAGTFATFRLVTTGSLPAEKLRAYSKDLLIKPQTSLKFETLIQRFHEKRLRLTPFAYALDVTGEKTFALIEADWLAGIDFAPSLQDGNWIQLQNICGG